MIKFAEYLNENILNENIGRLTLADINSYIKVYDTVNEHGITNKVLDFKIKNGGSTIYFTWYDSNDDVYCINDITSHGVSGMPHAEFKTLDEAKKAIKSM